MHIIGDPHLWLVVLVMINQTKAKINLSPQASWNQTGVTNAGQSNATSGSSLSQLNQPVGISITNNDVIYISDSYNNRIVVVHLDGTTNVSIIGSGPGNSANQFDFPVDLFITNTSLYVIDSNNHRVQKFSLNGSNATTVSNLSGLSLPYYLYVDNDENVYLSNTLNNSVLLFLSNSTNSIIVAGTGTPGSNSNELNQPYGVFVNQIGTIYIADCYNHRIMKWLSGASSGIMVAGSGTPGASLTQLHSPAQIIIDANDYMYISEIVNSRITRWAPTSSFGVCIAGCTGTPGTASTQLNAPFSFTFDSQSSLYVSDSGNNRVQKFQIIQYQSPSYNQPKLCSCATWNPNAITFANVTTVGPSPSCVFISRNNTVYVTAQFLNRVIVWLEGSVFPTRNLSDALNTPYAIFASLGGDVYVDNSIANYRVDKWTSNAINSVVEMYINGSCYGLFIDINNDLYVSTETPHQVIKRSLSNDANTSTVVGGNGTAGSASNMLHTPRGIFVTTKFDLYVADCNNNRVQLFPSGQLNATTVAGNGTSGTITLYYPTAVVLDADEYLFISDYVNNRIIRSGPFGFQCLFGCTNGSGSAPNQLFYPASLSFDSYGNLFVVDWGNNRVQKFVLATNSCVPSYNQPKFSSCATWNPNAITIANASLVDTSPYDVLVDINNTIYVPNTQNSSVQVWLEGNMTPVRTISSGLNSPCSIFVTLNGDVYVDNSAVNGQVDKWAANAANSTVAMYVNGTCYGLFIDIEDNLYCSVGLFHQVVKQSLKNGANISVVAGTGTAGSLSNMLDNPRGIFVDMNLNLYVADCGNNRIQLFQLDHLNGTTIVINGSNGTFALNCPTHVVLDMDGYLFITDGSYNRVLGSGPTGFRCIVGCTRVVGTASNQLNHPHSLSFDSYGNLFVIDRGNNRLQKFLLATNSCVQSSTNTQNLVTVSSQTGGLPLSSFTPSACPTPTQMGSGCNISSTPCDMLHPCQNNGTCINNNTTSQSYTCLCPFDFDGLECQFDHRPCQSNTCWNNGTCNTVSNIEFVCSCNVGWEGIHCETKINYCENVLCFNNGVCQPLLLNYSCQCLGESYSGQHCEITSNRIKTLQAISKSFGYIAIVSLISVAMFVVTMDVLKYFFNIDSTHKKTDKTQQKKKTKRTKPPVIIRYIYVNAPLTQSPEKPIATIEMITV